MNKKNYDKIAMWLINTECNFKCPYCFYDDSQRSLKHKIGLWATSKIPSLDLYKTRFVSPEIIRSFFDSAGGKWLIAISGGEPFVYPKFLDIVEALGEKHQMIIGTNLSLPVDDFIKRIRPESIHSFYASLHLGERERKGLSAQEFLSKAKKLSLAGFKVEIDYVMYPPLIARFKAIYEMFRKEGLSVEAKVFRGTFKGRIYPDAYTEEERKMFFEYIPSEVDRAASFRNLSFMGVPCTAGKNLIRIFPNGVITRCPHDRERLGNIFKNNLKLHKKVKGCAVPYCKCTLAIKEGCVDFGKRK